MAKDRATKPSSKRSKQNNEDQSEVVAESQQLISQELPVKSKQDINQTFDALYLQHVSKEFANDLEKLRTAGDFKGERSVQVLVAALRQGTACYNDDERRRIVG